MSADRSSPVKLDELYQEVILDHNKNPRNFGRLEGATAYAHGVNPLCGDDYEVFVSAEGVFIKKVAFHGQGCAISKASASMMTVALEGKSVAEVRTLKDHFIRLLTDASAPDSAREGVGRLKFFEGVRQFPARVKCATLAWRALEEALKEKDERRAEVSTEDQGERKRETS